MLSKIAQSLEKHENATRIKKLVFCALKRQWENDSAVLAKYRMETLLEELTKANPTLKQLHKKLYKIVETLNRKAVYHPLVKTIISQLAPLYNETAQGTTKSQENSLINIPLTPLNFEQTLQELTNSGNLLRIKKLIYCACEGRWETNSELLASLSLKDLTTKLMELNPSKEKIITTLHRVVKSLNRQEEYILVANLILRHLVKLYSIPEGNTQITSSRFPYPVEKEHNQSKVTIYGEETVLLQNRQKREPEYNLFDLRLEVMKYSNPLRAKIVIFSILQQEFDFSEAHWSLLKNYRLDDLLIKLYHHCANLVELEACLTKTAESLSHSYESNSNQVAGTIMNSLKPLYD